VISYRPGPALSEIGLAAIGRIDIRRLAQPVLEELRDMTQETSSLVLLEGRTVRFIDCVESPRSVRVGSRTGLVLPAHCTASGKAILATLPPADLKRRYAGQPLTTGAQAQAYADHYILVHMNTASKGKTYGEVSAAYTALTKDANADPAAVKAAGDLRQTMFMGDTLRGMLLNAYAFGTLGTIAIYAAIASLIGAAAMAALSLLGWRHLRRVPAEEEVRLGRRQAVPAPA